FDTGFCAGKFRWFPYPCVGNTFAANQANCPRNGGRTEVPYLERMDVLDRQRKFCVVSRARGSSKVSGLQCSQIQPLLASARNVAGSIFLAKIRQSHGLSGQ